MMYGGSDMVDEFVYGDGRMFTSFDYGSRDGASPYKVRQKTSHFSRMDENSKEAPELSPCMSMVGFYIHTET